MIFAVDSVPAVLAVSHEQFIVFSSNAFAILGLRALYFLLADMHARFTYLQQGLAVILAFVGVKMIIAEWYHIPTGASLGVIGLVLAVSIWLSIRHGGESSAEAAEHPMDLHGRAESTARDVTARRAVDRPDGDRRRRHRAAAVDGVDRRRGRRSSSRCARSGATGSGCARSTPRRRRRSTCARRPGATSASAATSPATSSRSSRSTSTSTSSVPSSTSRRRPGIQLTYTSTGQSRERARRKQLVDAMAAAVEWYHERLLEDPEARPARDYLRSRGLLGRRRPHVQARLGTRRVGRPVDAIGHRRRAAAGHRPRLHQPPQPAAGRAAGPGAVPDLLRHR